VTGVSALPAVVPAAPAVVPPAGRRGRPGGRARRIAALCGPAFVVSVAYVDPGNFATNMSGGASYGYTLLWVIAVANLVAMFVQALSAKLGIATGQSLAALCRRHLPRPLTWLLWAQGELIAIATDLAEFLGGAIALNLLFGVPLLPAAGVTAVVSAGLLALAPHGRRRFETVITGLLAVICAGFVYQAVLSPHLSRAAAGFVPHLAGRGSLVIAAGIVGATVMPHVIHLHSALTSNQALTGDQDETAGRAEAVRASRVDIGVALGVAGLVNMAMLVVAAAVLPGRDASTLTAIQADLGGLLGRGAAVAFALALLASGLASSSVGTYAGQVIMEGFLRRRIPLVARRLITMVPAFALIAAGADPVRLLIVSQVALSVGLPSVLIPLVVLTSRRSIMGALVNRRVTTVTAIAVTAAVTGLSGVLLCLALTA
jgi:manganese transport protein